MNETHCFELLIEVIAGLKLINSEARRIDTIYTAIGAQCEYIYKGQRYLLTITPTGETHDKLGAVTPSLKT